MAEDNDMPVYDVVLLPSYEQAESWRKRRALGSASGILGQTVTTFEDWVADLWELHGDGRAIVDPVQRAMAMQAAFSQGGNALPTPEAPGASGMLGAAAPGAPGAADGAHPARQDAARQGGGTGQDGSAVGGHAPGLVRMAARCERLAAGVPEYDAAIATARQGGAIAGLHARELALLQAIARYREILERGGLVEFGTACSQLAKHAEQAFPHVVRVLLEDASPLDWHRQHFLARCANLKAQVNLAPGADGVPRAPQGVRPRFGLPAGAYALPALVMDALRSIGPDDTAVVTSADPLALYRLLGPALAEAGLAGSVQAQVRFGSTDFGRACLLSFRLTRDGAGASDIVDAMLSPFSGFTARQAREADAALRADRLARCGEWVEDLRGRSDRFACLLALACDGPWEQALDELGAAARALRGRSPAWLAQQAAAMEGFRRVRREAQRLGVGLNECIPVLESLWLPVACAASGVPGDDAAAGIPGGGAPRVLVATQEAAARLAPGSCSLLVACDLTAADYPLSDSDDAAATLFGKLGMRPVDDALSQARRTFGALLRLPTRELLLVRPLNDADGNPAYPCAMLEEFVDAYRPPAADALQGPSPSELPPALAQEPLERGEELLFANERLAREDTGQEFEAVVPLPTIGRLRDAGALLPARGIPGTGGYLQGSPSPSQVELYLECPYKWFASRRLGIGRLEEGFGALERGTFAHAVLERFHRQRMDAGLGKLGADDLPEARVLLRRVADAVEVEMEQAVPGEGRYVPATQMERRELEELKVQLVDFLDYEVQVLPGFRPAYLEYPFDAAHAVEYAGRQMVATIDRIDVDNAGHAVVLDYKGSVKPAHDIAGKRADDPGKIQTRIYAQMARRALGLDVVGALYMSYGRKHALAGAVDSRVIEAPHVPGARKDAIWCALETLEMPSADGGAGGFGGTGPADAATAIGAATISAVSAPVADFGALAFPDMLDATEHLVAQAIDRMEAGDIAPRPANSAVCEYCPVADCPMRRS